MTLTRAPSVLMYLYYLLRYPKTKRKMKNPSFLVPNFCCSTRSFWYLTTLLTFRILVSLVSTKICQINYFIFSKQFGWLLGHTMNWQKCLLPSRKREIDKKRTTRTLGIKVSNMKKLKLLIFGPISHVESLKTYYKLSLLVFIVWLDTEHHNC